MRKLVTLALTLSLSVGALGGTSGAVVTGYSGACKGYARQVLRGAVVLEQVALRTFRIEAKPPKNVEVGGVASIPVVVTRPAEQDPLGQGIPTDDLDPEPAVGINVGVGLLIGDVFFPGFAVTNNAGKATIKIKIENYAKPGRADASFYAWKTQADTPCLRLDENGYRFYEKFFSVKR
jgi:hypothetical protein